MRPASSRTAGILTTALAVLASGTTAAFGQVSGALFTTDSQCEVVNQNLYSNERQVYINGGPGHEGSAGLPEGFYYVKVTAPNGLLLGSSVGAPVEVDANGEFVACYQLWEILVKASNGKQGYDETPNPGGVYKVWVSQNPDFPNSESKTDNFKVKRGRPVDQTEIRALKFYDLDADGVQGDPLDEPPIADWHIELRRQSDNALVGCQLTDGGGEAGFLVDRDGTAYVVLEVLVDGYVNTTPLSVKVVADQPVREVEFGNVCLEPAEGLGRTPGFWQSCNNPNGEGVVGCDLLEACDPAWRTLLNDLCLVWPDGSDFTIPGGSFADAFAALDGWITGAGAEGNMAYILSRQLAATALNRECGFMTGPIVVGECPAGTLVDLDELIGDANALLCANPLTLGSNPSVAEARAAQEAIKNCLDAINSNQVPVHVVSPTPCPFVPIPCP